MKADPWMEWQALDAELIRMSDGLAALGVIAPYGAGPEASQTIKAVRFVVTELENSLELARDAAARLRPELMPQAVREVRDAAA